MSLKDKLFLFLISLLGPVLILLLGKSLKIEWVGDENLKEIRQSKGKVLYAFWHGRMVILAYTHRGQKNQVLSSRHRDGQISARIIQRLGFGTVWGSTTRGGVGSLLQMVNKIRQGYDIAITPDGPKGPAFKAQPGTVFVAQKSGVPIIPITNSARRRWTLKSWDGFIIPKPFSKAVVFIGKPIYVPAELSKEELDLKSKELEENLNLLTEKADNYFKE
jgi:lysophospholipid acyltransferase (LPLAT)-like uncharacterized protein